MLTRLALILGICIAFSDASTTSKPAFTTPETLALGVSMDREQTHDQPQDDVAYGTGNGIMLPPMLGASKGFRAKSPPIQETPRGNSGPEMILNLPSALKRKNATTEQEQ